MKANQEQRQVVTRFAIHGFHHKLSKNKKFHKPTADCECGWCERYHIVNCENRIKTITEYSKEWPCKDKQFTCTFVRTYTFIIYYYRKKAKIKYSWVVSETTSLLKKYSDIFISTVTLNSQLITSTWNSRMMDGAVSKYFYGTSYFLCYKYYCIVFSLLISSILFH